MQKVSGKVKESMDGVRRLFLKPNYATLGNFSEAGEDEYDDEDNAYYFDQNLVKGEKTFLLETKGDSMINAHIQDGDMIMVNPDIKIPQNGDIVVARLGNDATVKRFSKEPDKRVRLQPENDTMNPIYVKEGDGDFEIIGKVVGVYRQM